MDPHVDQMDGERDRTQRELKSLLSEITREGSEEPPSGSKAKFDYGRFGLAWLILAVLAAVVGVYPLPIDMLTRVMFLCFALILALIGGYYFDRSTRGHRRGKAPPQGPSDTTQPRHELRRVK